MYRCLIIFPFRSGNETRTWTVTGKIIVISDGGHLKAVDTYYFEEANSNRITSTRVNSPAAVTNTLVYRTTAATYYNSLPNYPPPRRRFPTCRRATFDHVPLPIASVYQDSATVLMASTTAAYVHDSYTKVWDMAISCLLKQTSIFHEIILLRMQTDRCVD